ncbi:hypothetical protein EHEL_010430 [Encephalitozoon hellem ATCC 50504]|uniref:Uncharacterized protein n=1 Tax=Encephalitozoon hellem TaxID=27973 RepID=A0A9Q9C8M9_ENCHE|nr:uncharacterized protein EHEL_010430 [Encephalitozoon hellem ATCC 50504]AFM97667.1 hypothetical protein EHEL_010430 [Encephalitozoon hellem ATCC 50504]UTX42358.1 hypothetical protein GPU96_01g00600 [Encephalitozoon hellem]WEL37800.1 hypothetical protein PFJ87_01g00530 [Encephalitozoon hellem]|eukprot:XP_003886648.1 hypothetical protein EHEL_010430 [Encephalitozoon hellem ATCC 50504]
MGEHSFSLQFNPLQRIKTVKDYEKEIEELRNENFEIKHQLSHYKASSGGNIQEDIQKLLLDSKRSIDILEGENEELSKQVERMDEMVKKARKEKENAEAKLKEDLEGCLNKISMLEEENGRLLKHLESVNGVNAKLREENGMLEECFNRSKNAIDEQKSLIEKMASEKEERSQVEKELMSYKNALLNSNKEKDQIMYERERERSEYNNKISQLQGVVGSFEEKMNLKEAEMNQMREYYKTMEDEYKEMYRQKQSNELYLKEMGENYMRETREKQELALRNEDLRREIEQLKTSRNDLKKRLEVCENEKRALSYRVSQDVPGNSEFYRIKGELEKVRREKGLLTEEIEGLKKKCLECTTDLERSRELEMFLKDLLQEKGRECDRRLGEIEKMASSIEAKVDLATKALGERRRWNGAEGGTDTLLHEIKELQDKVEEYRRMAAITEDNKRFLKALGVDPLEPLDEIVRKFRGTYKEAIRKMRVMDKEANEAMRFAEDNKDVMDKRTMKFLEDFTREFNIARKDLEVCKRYLEKKGKENKELKASNQALEKKFNECRRNEEKIKDLYSAVVDKLRRKDEVISKLEMRIGARL